MLGIDSNRVVCRVKRMGGGFGGKESRGCVIALPCALAAKKYVLYFSFCEPVTMYSFKLCESSPYLVILYIEEVTRIALTVKFNFKGHWKQTVFFFIHDFNLEMCQIRIICDKRRKINIKQVLNPHAIYIWICSFYSYTMTLYSVSLSRMLELFDKPF